jgi:hypothetical protein
MLRASGNELSFAVIARLDRANQHASALMMDRKALEYRAARFCGW